MKSRTLLACLTVACLVCGGARAKTQARNEADTAQIAPADNSAAGRVTGMVRDPMGALVAGARIELKSASSAAEWTRETTREGQFLFDGVAPGLYQLTVIVSGFEMTVVRDVRVDAGRETVVNVTLRIAPARTEIEVREDEEIATRRKVSASDQGRHRNLGELAAEEPGVSLRESGALDGSPALHGLGDERTKVVVNGTTEENSCPNHMNPLLSETQMAGAATVRVTAGITPVSMGGDSLGGTIEIDEPPPIFASAQEKAFEQGSATGFYRSNGEYYGGSVTAWAATQHLAMGYTGTWNTNNDYSDGSGHKVTSTYAQTTEHTLTLAARKRQQPLDRGRRLLAHAIRGLRESADGSGARRLRARERALSQHVRARHARSARQLARHVARDERGPRQAHLSHAHVDADEYARARDGLFTAAGDAAREPSHAPRRQRVRPLPPRRHLAAGRGRRAVHGAEYIREYRRRTARAARHIH